jgi:hypothetical protein
LEVTDTSTEPPPPPTTTTTNTEITETNNENNQDESVEPMMTIAGGESTDDVVLPGLDLNAEDNEKKRKRTSSQVKKSLTFCNLRIHLHLGRFFSA